jgi:hypothetical protein
MKTPEPFLNAQLIVLRNRNNIKERPGYNDLCKKRKQNSKDHGDGKTLDGAGACPQ